MSPWVEGKDGEMGTLYFDFGIRDEYITEDDNFLDACPSGKIWRQMDH